MGNKHRQWAERQSLKPGPKATLRTIADFCWDEIDGLPNCEVKLKMSTIAERTGAHIDTVGAHIRLLVTKGYLAKENNSRKSGAQGANTYTLLKEGQMTLDFPAPLPKGVADLDGYRREKSGDKSVDKPVDRSPAAPQHPVFSGGAPGESPGGTRQNTGPIQTTPSLQILTNLSAEEFIGKFPEGGIVNIDLVRREWERLASEDRRAAMAALPIYAKCLKANPWRSVKAAHRWLRERCWEEFPPAPERPQDTRYFARVGSAQWDAWVAYETRQTGRAPFWAAFCINHSKQTWPFESEWPPTAKERMA